MQNAVGFFWFSFVDAIWVNRTGAWHHSLTMGVSTGKLWSSRCWIVWDLLCGLWPGYALQRTAQTPNIAATATNARPVKSIRHGADQKRPVSPLSSCSVPPSLSLLLLSLRQPPLRHRPDEPEKEKKGKRENHVLSSLSLLPPPLSPPPPPFKGGEGGGGEERGWGGGCERPPGVDLKVLDRGSTSMSGRLFCVVPWGL